MATAMYYSGYDPRTMEEVYVPRDPHEKAMQRALLQYRNPQNYDLVYEALIRTGRMDLVGHGPKCLIRPTKPKANGQKTRRSNPKNKTGSKSGVTTVKQERKQEQKTERKTEKSKANTAGKSAGKASVKGRTQSAGKTGGKPVKNSSNNIKKSMKKDK
jgi:hypothetical protein